MKIDPKDAIRPPPARPFRDTLRPAAMTLPVLKRPAPGLRLVANGDRSARTLKEVRAGHDAHAQTLEARAQEHCEHHEAHHQADVHAKVVERIVQEVERDRPPSSTITPTPSTTGGPATESPQAAPPMLRVHSVREVIEKIELFLKGNRPALALTVGGTMQAKVTLERTGPGRVALSFKGRNGPPSHSEVQAVRESIEARGLKLTSLRLA